jgi:RimJ/RimL family protein N-acetyltransferase
MSPHLDTALRAGRRAQARVALAGAPPAHHPVVPAPVDRTAAVTFRRYRSTDRPAVSAMSDALSDRSLYQRFFTGHPRLPVAFLDRLDHSPAGRDLVLLAVLDSLVLGVGELIVGPDEPHRGDIGLLVRDSHHRQGIGLRLVRGLMAHAQACGVSTVRAEVLTENRGVRALIARHYPAMTATLDGEMVRYELALSDRYSVAPRAWSSSARSK